MKLIVAATTDLEKKKHFKTYNQNFGILNFPKM